MIMLATAGATACGATKPVRVHSAETAHQVADLLRATWGVSTGYPSFDYSCTRLDDRGQLFSCLARDQYRIVRLASFDVVCRASNCEWTYYPAYIG